MTLRNLAEAEAVLQTYAPPRSQMTAKDTTLDRIKPLMRLLGNPQDRLKIIHIAGTSGKTSTAYYMAALLRAAGKRVGLTVSPHIDSVTERIQINGKPIEESIFCKELGAFLEIVERAQQQPTYFELLYAFTLWMLERLSVDYAVVETGVGGLHDATNVAKRADKVCIITDIGFDHTHLLGKTLPEIAAQKAGIIHEGNHMFMYDQSEDVTTVINRWAEGHYAPIHIVSEPPESDRDSLGISTMPPYQQRNWFLAYTVYQYLSQRDELPHLTRQALRETGQITIPGRMDIRQAAGKTVIMDGAHNVQKMGAFMDSFRRLYPGVKPALLLALKTTKDYQPLVEFLAPLAARIITTSFEASQDLPHRSIDPDILAEEFRKAGVTQVESVADQSAALRNLLDGPEQVCIITGSFYLLGQIRNNKHWT